MSKFNRNVVRGAAAVTMPVLAWYAIARHAGDLVQASHAMLVLLGLSIIWVSIAYENLILGPLQARSARRSTVRDSDRAT